jgi:hypothetical protein
MFALITPDWTTANNQQCGSASRLHYKLVCLDLGVRALGIRWCVLRPQITATQQTMQETSNPSKGHPDLAREYQRNSRKEG